MYLIHNGQRKKTSDFFISLENRSFLYGDGFFDTLRVENNEIPWLDFHFFRWEKSCKVLSIQSPFSKEAWKDWILSLVSTPNARVRTQLWSGEGLGYGNRGNSETLIQVFPWEPNRWKELKGGICLDTRIPSGNYQWMKLNAAFFYSMMEKKSLDLGWNEGILLNQRDELVEGCHSALFWKRKGQWFTHPNGEDGIWSTAKAAALGKGNPQGEVVVEGRLHLSEIDSVSDWAMGNALDPWVPFQLGK